jgi:hypothetical protein
LPLGFTSAKACFGPDFIEAAISLYLTGNARPNASSTSKTV